MKSPLPIHCIASQSMVTMVAYARSLKIHPRDPGLPDVLSPAAVGGFPILYRSCNFGLQNWLSRWGPKVLGSMRHLCNWPSPRYQAPGEQRENRKTGAPPAPPPRRVPAPASLDCVFGVGTAHFKISQDWSIRRMHIEGRGAFPPYRSHLYLLDHKQVVALEALSVPDGDV